MASFFKGKRRTDTGSIDASANDAASPEKASRFWRHSAVLAVVAMVGVGSSTGLGLFTFGYSGGTAYLSNDPAACANCHIMQSHYDAWQNSSHHHVATCNDCHLPHDFVGKWITKADNGFFHSLAFTTGDFHEPIQIKPRNRRVTQNTCLHCHADFVHQTLPSPTDSANPDPIYCVHCHQSVGHRHR